MTESIVWNIIIPWLDNIWTVLRWSFLSIFKLYTLLLSKGREVIEKMYQESLRSTSFSQFLLHQQTSYTWARILSSSWVIIFSAKQSHLEFIKGHFYLMTESIVWNIINNLHLWQVFEQAWWWLWNFIVSQVEFNRLLCPNKSPQRSFWYLVGNWSEPS